MFDFLAPDFDERVQAIQTMREETKDAKDKRDAPIGPISHALQFVNGFDCPASKWTKEHLIRFQVIILKDLVAPYLFPQEFLPRDSDITMTTLSMDGFFIPTTERISQGQWNKDALSHFIFLFIMLLLRGGDRTPTPRNSPKHREILPRGAKESPNQNFVDTYTQAADAFFPSLVRVSSTATTSSPLSSTLSSQFRPSFSSSDSRPVVDYGPRETLSFILFLQFLSYLGTIEQKVNNNTNPVWIPW